MKRLFVLSIAMVMLTSAAVSARMIDVPDDSTTIQKGINGAMNGDTVLVAPGGSPYMERINFNGKAISVISSAGYAATVIDGSNGGNVVTFNHSETQEALLRGFTIRNGSTYGVYTPSPSVPRIDSCYFTNNQRYHIYSIDPRYVESIVGFNRFQKRADNAYNVFPIRAGTITASTAWPVPPDSFCYLIIDNITVSGPSNPVWTVLPGTVIKMASAVQMTIGGTASNQAGKIIAENAVFTSYNDDTLGDANGNGPTTGSPGDWYTMLFYTYSDDASVIRNCTFKYAGNGNYGALYLYGASPHIENNLITRNYAYGLRAYSENDGDNVKGNTFVDNAGYHVLLHPGSVDTVVARNTFVANSSGQKNAIVIYNGDGSPITESTTWPIPPTSYTYYVASGHYIRIFGAANPTLTLQAGTVIKFIGDSYLQVGGDSNGEFGKLIAEGVTFTSANDDTLGDATGNGPTNGAPGDWYEILFHTYSDDASLLHNCLIRYAGYNSYAGVYLYNASPHIENNIITQIASYGLRAYSENDGDNTKGNTFIDNPGYHVLLHPGSVDTVVARNTFVPNTSGQKNAIVIYNGDDATITETTTWPVPPVNFTYLVASNNYIRVYSTANPMLTLLAGTVIKFYGSSFLQIGGASGGQYGKLNAEGVAFTSANDDTLGDASGNGFTSGEPGDWYKILFYTYSDDASLIRDCIIRYAGGDGDGGVYLYSASPHIEGNIIAHNAAYGLRALSENCGDNTKGNTFIDNPGYHVLLHPGSVDTVVARNTFIPNESGQKNAIMIYNGDNSGVITESTTWPLQPEGYTYCVAAGHAINVYGSASPVLTLLPGTAIKFYGSSYLRIGADSGTNSGKLNAECVVFTSTFDDTLGDANGNGFTTGNPGDWQGILFRTQANPSSTISNCIVRYAGSNNYGNISLYSCSPKISCSEIGHSSTAGIYAYGNVLDTISNCYIHNNTNGIYCLSNANAIIRRCNISQNLQTGVKNTTSTIMVNADNNWWGSSTGPRHSTNPGGTGDSVSNYVDFDPWQNAPLDFAVSCGEVPPPPPPTLISPADGFTIFGGYLDFDWSDSPTATRYAIQIDTDPLFSPPLVADSNVTLSQFSNVDSLANGHYYWRVKAGNSNGWSEYTSARSFSICYYIPGDANFTGIFTGLDVVYAVAFLKGGPTPNCRCECPPLGGNIWPVCGDVNGSCTFTGLDVTYMVARLKGGPPLVPCPSCPPSSH